MFNEIMEGFYVSLLGSVVDMRPTKSGDYIHDHREDATVSEATGYSGCSASTSLHERFGLPSLRRG